MGALIGLRLANQVCSALKVPSSNVTYWVDRLNVGFWIRGQSRVYKPFVAHRMGEIHEKSNLTNGVVRANRYESRRSWNQRDDQTRADRQHKMVEQA